MSVRALGLIGHSERVTCLEPIPNKMQLLSTANDLTCRLWDLRRPGMLHMLNGHSKGTIKAVSCSKYDLGVTTSSLESHVCIWDLSSTGKCIQTLEQAHPGGISSISLRSNDQDHSNTNPDRTLDHNNTSMVTGGMDGVVKLWSVEASGCQETGRQEWKQHKAPHTHRGCVMGVDCRPSMLWDPVVVSAAHDGRLMVSGAGVDDPVCLHAHTGAVGHMMLSNEQGVDSVGSSLRVVTASSSDNLGPAAIKVWDFN
eukprot:TRINITY_DN4762_c0_g1_i1.p1 TRINITY_DN4762_c0_g1~~TRINITY_DN4762_c0_g1_i1.p1  ORF type:complete len:255 (-),score=28.44 TRINITY_DN4762_c0_g1_i1:234-998(-)